MVLLDSLPRLDSTARENQGRGADEAMARLWEENGRPVNIILESLHLQVDSWSEKEEVFGRHVGKGKFGVHLRGGKGGKEFTYRAGRLLTRVLVQAEVKKGERKEKRKENNKREEQKMRDERKRKDEMTLKDRQERAVKRKAEARRIRAEDERRRDVVRRKAEEERRQEVRKTEEIRENERKRRQDIIKQREEGSKARIQENRRKEEEKRRNEEIRVDRMRRSDERQEGDYEERRKEREARHVRQRQPHERMSGRGTSGQGRGINTRYEKNHEEQWDEQRRRRGSERTRGQGGDRAGVRQHAPILIRKEKRTSGLGLRSRVQHERGVRKERMPARDDYEERRRAREARHAEVEKKERLARRGEEPRVRQGRGGREFGGLKERREEEMRRNEEERRRFREDFPELRRPGNWRRGAGLAPRVRA